MHLKPMPHEKPLETPALTWTEYLRLLETARTLEDRRPYLLVKLFCNTGLRIRELPNVTVEAVKAVEMTTGFLKSPKRLLFPSALRAKLLDYASGAGIRSGSLFVRQNGNPLCLRRVISAKTVAARKTCVFFRGFGPSFFRIARRLEESFEYFQQFVQFYLSKSGSRGRVIEINYMKTANSDEPNSQQLNYAEVVRSKSLGGGRLLYRRRLLFASPILRRVRGDVALNTRAAKFNHRIYSSNYCK